MSLNKKKCPYCGKEVSSDAKFCIYCGKEMAKEKGNVYCVKCGKENASSDLFCSECGKSLQDSNQNYISIEETAPYKPKKKKGMLLGIIAVIVILFIVIVGSGPEDIEYTNNSEDQLPIVVNQISYQESYWTGYMDITFEIENLTQTDYKDVRLAVLAWDSEGYPIRLCGMYEYAPDYVSYIGLENVSPAKVNEYSYTFETADIAYMSVFLSYYEDFNGNEWENPITEEVEENQGQKLDETELYYFTFQK